MDPIESLSNAGLSSPRLGKGREYGNGAVLGVAVPQANSIVEPEMAALLPAGFSMLGTRLKGSRTDSRQRFLDSFANLGSSLDAYDNAKLDAVGYACTSSSYLVGADDERRRLDALQERFGYPIVTSVQALESALDYLDARRIALFAPYPAWLVEASQRYWHGRGLDLVDCQSVDADTTDTRNIYGITTPMVLESFKKLRWQHADAIVLTGTGMPTLRAITELSQLTGKPVLSSNLCLAWALVRTVGGQDYLAPPSIGEPLFGGWAVQIPI
jgi:maleate isomerase